MGGVKVSSQSPLDPVLGTLWVDSDKDKLFVFDGTLWRGVSGSGGGGGGSVNIIGGAGIDAVDSGSTVTLSVDAGTAINLTGDTVNVTAGQGITTDANDVSVDPGAGIDLSGGLVNVTEGEGIHIKSDAVAAEIQSDAVTTGLQPTGSGNDKALQVKPASEDQLGSVRLTAAPSRWITPELLVRYCPTRSLTKEISTQAEGTADDIPSGGPVMLIRCLGGHQIEGTCKQLLLPRTGQTQSRADTTATLGDLPIINSGDGSGAGEWTLVKTGTVDNSASISVGDGQENAYPPSSPKEGDVWYNLDDGRTYVLIQDGGGQNEWVDVSPQGNQMLWKQDTAGVIEPQTNTDALKIPKLATNSTAGTRIAMVDANQTFVANAVGDGLMIDGGVLQFAVQAPVRRLTTCRMLRMQALVQPTESYFRAVQVLTAGHKIKALLSTKAQSKHVVMTPATYGLLIKVAILVQTSRPQSVHLEVLFLLAATPYFLITVKLPLLAR